MVSNVFVAIVCHAIEFWFARRETKIWHKAIMDVMSFSAINFKNENFLAVIMPSRWLYFNVQQ